MTSPKEPAVMARMVRLPTQSIRQARSIVKLQLDRLSPVAAADAVFDLVLLRTEGAEGVYALGVVRKGALEGLPNEASALQIARMVEGAEVTFRFRRPGAALDFETRWLARAPQVAAIAVGVAVLAVSISFKVSEWRDRALPELAAAERAGTLATRAAGQRLEARDAWLDHERTDGATSILCLNARLTGREPDGGYAIDRISAAAQNTRISSTDASLRIALRALGDEVLITDEADGFVADLGSEACG